MKFAIAAVFCLGFATSALIAVSAQANDQREVLLSVADKSPSACIVNYDDATIVVRSFMKLNPLFRTAANLKKMLDVQTDLSKSQAMSSPGCAN